MTKQDAPTTTDAERALREEFEDWAKSDRSWVPNVIRKNGSYESLITAAAWHGFQAARASSAAAQPKPDAYLIRCAESGFLRDFADYYDADQFWIHGSARRLIKPQFLFCYEVPLTAPPAKPADTGEASNA